MRLDFAQRSSAGMRLRVWAWMIRSLNKKTTDLGP